MSTIKDELIGELQRRVADKILEPTNAELLTKLINNADSDNEAMMIAELGTTYKRTGLHFDKRLEKMTEDIHYFRKNESLSFHTDDNKPIHKLITGDNYEALQNLLIQYKGKVDVIYIDPPYGKDSMGEFAETNYENAITRDNLLSMLYPRLQLAKMLLSDSGVIFCSIDDKNQAYVKCLFDEVMCEHNYIETFIWNKTSTPPALSSKSRKTHEFVLCYQKRANSEKFVGLTNEGGDAPLLNESNKESILFFPANYVVANMKNGIYKAGIKERVELLDDVEVKDGKIISEFRLKGKFRWQQSTLDSEIKDGEICDKKFSPGSDIWTEEIPRLGFSDEKVQNDYEKFISDIESLFNESSVNEVFINAKIGEESEYINAETPLVIRKIEEYDVDEIIR